MGLFDSIVGAVFQHRENKDARDWSENMSNTAHQREVKDLEAAGLNPVLSAMGGAGANVPAASNAPLPQIRADATSIMALKMMGQEYKNLQKTEENIAMDTNVKRATTMEANARYLHEIIKGTLTTQTIKESEAREREAKERAENLQTQSEINRKESRIMDFSTDAAEAAASMAQIRTEREMRSFEKVDNGKVGRTVLPYIDRLIAPYRDFSASFKNFNQGKD